MSCVGRGSDSANRPRIALLARGLMSGTFAVEAADGMNRREVIIVLLGACASAATPAAAQIAAPQLPRVIWVSGGDAAGARPFVDSFLKGMTQLGHRDGGSFRLEVRYANMEPARVPVLIREAVQARPNVLMVAGLRAARHARDATNTVPVVVTTAGDLVEAGIVKSFSHPGGNITGLSDLADELAVKRLELLKETLPKASRVALLLNPDFPASPKIELRIRAAAGSLGISISRLDATDLPSLLLALDSLRQSQQDALLAGGDSLHVVRAREMIERATILRVPVIHYWPGTAEMGALISHQADIHYNFERAAYYVDRILKGAKPGDLPIEQPTRYELVVNKKVAIALDLTIPSSILLRADRIIE
jgi:putative tryptophan/tyrosine transport system substrate-binding protein